MALTKKAGKLARIVSKPPWLRALLHHKVAAGVEHVSVLRTTAGLQTIVDVGANRGQFALAARYCFPEAQLYCFEPLSGPAAQSRAVFAKDPRATFFEVALGPESGDAVIHVSGRDDSSSLLPITSMQDTLFPGTAEVDTRSIRVARLAELVPGSSIRTPALLKIDVQGFERQVLAGCEDVLDRFDWVYVECSFLELYQGQARADEVIAWLRERHLELRGVYHIAYDTSGQTVQADFLFARRVTPEQGSRTP